MAITDGPAPKGNALVPQALANLFTQKPQLPQLCAKLCAQFQSGHTLENPNVEATLRQMRGVLSGEITEGNVIVNLGNYGCHDRTPPALHAVGKLIITGSSDEDRMPHEDKPGIVIDGPRAPGED